MLVIGRPLLLWRGASRIIGMLIDIADKVNKGER